MPTRKSKVFKKKEIQSRSKFSRKSIAVTHVAAKRKIKKNRFGKKRSVFKKRCSLNCEQVFGVERLLTPFHKFYKSQPDALPKDTKMILNVTKTGLTPKETNYIICSCSQRSSRYARLKALAYEAEVNKKVFLINGKCKALRDALVERGWVEKIPPARMNLSTIRNTKYEDDSAMHLALERLLLSNLVQKSVPYFVWDLKEGWESDSLVQNHKVIHNKFTNEAALWATKQGLCASVRHNYWYFIEGVAEVNSPRTYNSFDEEEKEEFNSDYKLTACTSLLKWVLSMAANDQPIFCENGTVSLKVIVFALKRCKEYLFKKQNKDIDAPCPRATNSQWNAFLKKYYIIIAKQEKFKPDKENKVPLYLSYAKYVIRAIYKYRSQLSCEGCHNIWIIKPAHCSRGRGIRLASKLAVLTDLLNKGKYVFQKYIEESMLIHETKFDVRQYYLVTSTTPLVIWMYQDCYLKFSSQKYNLKNFHESIHLTNNAVQRKYKNCTNRHPELPQHNMWSLATFKEYLNKSGRQDVWEQTIYPGMRKSIIGIMLSCQESTTSWKNRFELYGCDFILDKNCKPWLIEINSGPDLNPTTKVTAEICPAVLSDVIKVVVDRVGNPKASTGKFECIYRQHISMRPCGRADNLIVQGSSLPSNYFNRGNTDGLINVISKEKPEKTDTVKPNRKKSKFSQKVSFKNAKLDDCIEYPDSPIISFHSEHKSAFSLHSSPSSNNFRHIAANNENYFNDMKSIVTKPIHALFGFSKLDDDEEDNCRSDKKRDVIGLDPIMRSGKKIILNMDNVDIIETTPQLPSQEKDVKNDDDDDDDSFKIELSASEPVSPTALTGGVVQIEPDGGNKTEETAGSVTEVNDEFFEASKKIFSFLDRKHKEYVKDVFLQK